MTELYIFNRDDELLTILTESNGLISAPVRDELNEVSDTPFTFTVDAHVEYEQSYSHENQLTQVASAFIGVYGNDDVSEKKNVSPAQFVKEGNSVVFKDIEGRLREFIIKELDDSNGIDGAESTATCLPTFIDELSDHYVLDKRYSNSKPQRAMDDIVNGTRFEGVVDGSFGEASTNFYRITSADALFKMRDAWGGDLTDEIELNEYGRISKRKVILRQRLGADNGLRFEIDHNIEGIERTVISYPKTAMYGYGASLETEGGGNTRYIDFADVEWKKSNGDPVDKPKGQTWVGDPDALNKNGIPKGDGLLHRYGKFSNQDYEGAEELLWATWQSLQDAKEPEVNYKLSVDLLDKKASLGDTAIAIDREFARPIEIQTRIIAVEYDLVDIESTTDVEMGQFLNLRDDRLDKMEDEIDSNRGKWEHPTIDNGSFPDTKPSKPSNVTATGAFQTIQLMWDYADEVYIASYEVYASRVSDFVPDEQHMVYRGKVSAFSHEVETDETWYYYVRAVNTHGTTSEFSDKLSASTVRIIDDDILFGEDIASSLRGLSKTAGILADDTVDFDKFADSIKDGNRIKGDILMVDGTTYIAEGVIGNAAIENGAITNLKVGRGAIDTLQVKDGAITNAKIKSLSADKVDATELSAITANLGDVTGGKITQKSSNGRVELFDGEIRSYYKNDLALEISEYKMLFFNEDSSEIGALYPVTSLTSGERGLALEVSDQSYFITGPRIDGVVYPSLAVLPYDNRTYLAGPYNGAVPGSRLELYANRRHLSYEVDFSMTDQPSIIMDQSNSTNDMIQYFGGTNRRTNSVWQVRWNHESDGWTSRITASSEGVELRGKVTGDSQSTGNILGNEGFPYYENMTGGNRFLDASDLYAGGLKTLSGYRNIYLSTRQSGEVRVVDGHGNNPDGDNVYRDIRASDFVQSSSENIKKNIKPLKKYALDVLSNLNVVEYTLIEKGDGKINVLSKKEEERVKVGFVAQKSKSIATDDGGAIKLGELMAYNTKAIQELHEKIKNLEEPIK